MSLFANRLELRHPGYACACDTDPDEFAREFV